MLLNTAIFQQLSVHAGLSGYIGSGGLARLYPFKAAQGCALPYVTMQRIDTTPTYTHDGGQNIAEDAVQFDVWAEDGDTARLVAAQLKRALDELSSPAVNRAFITRDNDAPDEDTGLCRVSIDADIWSTLTAP